MQYTAQSADTLLEPVTSDSSSRLKTALGLDHALEQSIRPIKKGYVGPEPGGTIAVLCAVGLVVCACVVTILLGLPHTSIYGHDLFITVDGAWRILQGQRPHVDFYSVFGPITYLIPAAGLWLSNGQLEGLVYSTAAVGLLLGAWATALGAARLRPWFSTLFAVIVTLFWLAPFPLGESFHLTGYAMQYNRLGYALVSLLLVEQFGHRYSSGKAPDWGGISTGIALGFLLFLKISFFIVGCPIVVAGIWLGRYGKRYLLQLILGILTVSLILFAYLHWDFLAIFSDLKLAAQARQGRLHTVTDLARTLTRNSFEITSLIAFGAMLCLHLKRQARQDFLTPRGVFVFGMLVLGADFLLAIGNTQRAGFPLSLIGVLIMANHLTVRASDPTFRIVRGQPSNAIVVLCAAFLVLLPTISATVNSWGIVMARKTGRTALEPSVALDAAPLRAMHWDDHADAFDDIWENNGAPLTIGVNEGLALLRAHSGTNESITCLCFANPFSYALQRSSPQGGATFFAQGTNFTETAHPTSDRILGGAALVLYPNQDPGRDGVDTLLQICGPDLDAHYRKVARTDHWTLLRRES